MELDDKRSVRRGIGGCVRAEASRHGLRQQDLAVRLGLSQGSISARFAGKVPFAADELSCLAEWFGTPVERFFEWRTEGMRREG